MPAAIPIAGAVIGAIGSKKSADAQKKAAQSAAQSAQFNPYGISGLLGGNLSWNGNNANVSASQGMQNTYGLLGNAAQGALSGDQTGLVNFANSLGSSAIPGLFGDAINAAGFLPTDQFNASQAALGGLGGNINSLLAQMGGSLNGIPGSIDFSQANGFLGKAAGALGNVPMDVSQLVNDRLGLLRQQAAPQEQAAGQALEQRLFSQGRLGTTGGSKNIEAFARGLGQADLGRQLAAQDLGMQAQQQNAAIQQANAGLFGNLAGQSANQAVAGFQGQLNRGGLFNDSLNSMLNGIGMQGNLAQQLLGNATNYSDLTNSRAQQRMSNALGLFGFGQDMQGNLLNQGLQALGGQQSIDAQLREMIALGGNLGGTAANAGANVARAQLANSGSPGGAFLAQLGGGLFQNSMERWQDQINQRNQPVK